MTQEEEKCFEEWNNRLEKNLEKERLNLLHALCEKYGNSIYGINDVEEGNVDIAKLQVFMERLFPKPIKVKRIEVREYNIGPELFMEYPSECLRFLEGSSPETVIKEEFNNVQVDNDYFQDALVRHNVTIDISK